MTQFCPEWIFGVCSASTAKEFLSSENSLNSISRKYSEGLSEKFNEISFNRKEFNELEEIEKKLILKSKCESLSKLVFIEKKHLDIIVEKCLSKNNNFSLDMPGPVTIKVNREQITLKL